MTHRWLLVQAERGQPAAFLKMVTGQERLYPGIIVSNSTLGLLYGHGILTIYENLLL